MGSACMSARYGTWQGGKRTDDRGLEVGNYLSDSLPLGESGDLDGGSDDALEDRKARQKGDSNSRESHRD
jgi:hypothetical protein